MEQFFLRPESFRTDILFNKTTKKFRTTPLLKRVKQVERAQNKLKQTQKDTSDKFDAFQAFFKGEGAWDDEENSGTESSLSPKSKKSFLSPKSKKVQFHHLVAKAQKKHEEEQEANKEQSAAATASAAAAKAAVTASAVAEAKRVAAAKAEAEAVAEVEKRKGVDVSRATVTTPLLVVLFAAQLGLKRVHDLAPYYLVAAGMLHVGLQLRQRTYAWVKGVSGYVRALKKISASIK